KGVGTFVRPGVLDYDLGALVSFTGKAAAAGKKPGTRVLAFAPAPASELPAPVAVALRLRPDDPVYRIERLRLADGVPVILERRVVVADLCPGLTRADLESSLYGLWTDRYKLEIAGAEQTIRAAALQGPDAKALGVPAGTAALVVRSVGVLRGDRPLWWERTLYRGDAYAFRNRLGPIRSARPAAGELLGPEEEDLA